MYGSQNFRDDRVGKTARLMRVTPHQTQGIRASTL